MLILSRRPGEEIYIDDGNGNLIRVAVLGVIGNQVRFGIQAPKHVQVDRAEVYQRKVSGDAYALK